MLGKHGKLFARVDDIGHLSIVTIEDLQIKISFVFREHGVDDEFA